MNALPATLTGAINRANTRLNSVLSSSSPAIGSTGTSSALPFVFAGLLLVFILIAVFYKQITHGLNYVYDSIRGFLGAPDKQRIKNPEEDAPITDAPVPPQNEIPNKQSLAEKVMPGRQEVFNVSKNHFTYYDAEPLCKALGAELATYEQVKESWDKGGDWCNYGWTKGQNAVYPTQVSTWEKLQQGPEDQRQACGRPGVNGGFFDNPELRFGVNCYGVKPAQSKHDADEIARRDGEPLTPGAIEFDKKVSHYRSEADHIGLLPFNRQQWDSP
jgi:hypothetical protein